MAISEVLGTCVNMEVMFVCLGDEPIGSMVDDCTVELCGRLPEGVIGNSTVIAVTL